MGMRLLRSPFKMETEQLKVVIAANLLFQRDYAKWGHPVASKRLIILT